ncbi:exopolysaccharide biosynthesis protein [Phenylobacterium sp. LjRoot219]|uniref:exopolysaccharide biosynthesis protein n=1 Tax=Phenylobacterium sp. LjRoot219 TaxID=3342283 RepID=UPI003ECD318F
MSGREQLQDLDDLLDELDRCADQAGDKVSVQEVVDAIGRRSFGPLLLVAGLLGMTPVAAVPGAPTIIAVLILLMSVQLLFGRKSVWLPRVLLKLSVKADKLKRAVKVVRKPARFVDRLVKPRLEVFTGPTADRMVALACTVLALMTPPLELLPLVAFFPSAAVAIFGLGLIARDGLLVLIGLTISAGVLGVAVYHLVR